MKCPSLPQLSQVRPLAGHCPEECQSNPQSTQHLVEGINLVGARPAGFLEYRRVSASPTSGYSADAGCLRALELAGVGVQILESFKKGVEGGVLLLEDLLLSERV